MKAITGLSPRVRGNPAASRAARHYHRSIPACAGEPLAHPQLLDALKVYPRVCGGTHYYTRTVQDADGLHYYTAGRRWSIPACAGEPGILIQGNETLEVYSRVCGGTPPPSPPAARPKGLSPRVRGNPSAPPAGRFVDGSIPACAGEPPAHLLITSSRTVYPRVCGGTDGFGGDASELYGLSPRVRGNLDRLQVRIPQLGSIPACAGEPASTCAACPEFAVYPRVCGGTLSVGEFCLDMEGLSPRVRGNRRNRLMRDAVIGSIPACAGEPTSLSTAGGWRRVYPRVCGGTSKKRH